MAFSCGFFNSKGLDRTYTAENFTEYLSSLICNGILDTYGSCFGLSRSLNSLSVGIGTGKAWIDGHYFINDASYAIDLKRYQDESLPRYVSIGIVLDTSESVRDVRLEVIAGTPAESPSVPEFTETDTKKRLHLYSVRINPGATAFEAADITDFREDKSKCGYCICILGKCRVSEVLAKLASLTALIDSFRDITEDLTNKVDELTVKVEDVSGEVLEMGQCGENVTYVIYSTGKVLLRGSGAMYDYASPISHDPNQSPFRDRDDLTAVIVANGITSIGDYAFENTGNLTSASLPKSLVSVGNSAFMYAQNYSGPVYGLTSLHIPDGVTTLKRKAFMSAAITEVTIPASVTTVGDLVFADCSHLTTARVEGKAVGDTMFSRCSSLHSVTLANKVKSIGKSAFVYCDSLTEITYEGTLEEWQSISKGDYWDGRALVGDGASTLVRVQCLNGYMKYDDESKAWTEVRD